VNRDRKPITRRTAPHSSDAGNLPILLLNKPYGVLCQFTDEQQRPTLSDYLDAPGYYPAGRLDRDSEGLMLLTCDGRLQQRISDPKFKMLKTYLVQVDGDIDDQAIAALNAGVQLKDGPAHAIDAQKTLPPESLWSRDPPVRFRQHIPTSWLQLGLRQGRNRQVRRMTAAVGFPTLRLIRLSIGRFSVWPLAPGQSCYASETELNQ